MRTYENHITELLMFFENIPLELKDDAQEFIDEGKMNTIDRTHMEHGKEVYHSLDLLQPFELEKVFYLRLDSEVHEKLPEAITACPNLRILMVAGSYKDLSVLEGLTNLRKLMLYTKKVEGYDYEKLFLSLTGLLIFEGVNSFSHEINYLPNLLMCDMYADADDNVVEFPQKLTKAVSIAFETCLMKPLPDLSPFKHLSNLVFLDTQLDKIPPSIGKLKNLRRLVLLSNNLTSLPKETLQLDKLEHLDIGLNNFTSLSSEYYNMSSLKNLDTRDNPCHGKPFLKPKEIIDEIYLLHEYQMNIRLSNLN